jgi:hypothetical protein
MKRRPGPEPRDAALAPTGQLREGNAVLETFTVRKANPLGDPPTSESPHVPEHAV